MPEEKRRISPAVAIIPIGIGLAAIGVLVAVAWAAPPTPPPGKANLYGRVTDAETGQPIQGVMVTLNGLEVYTDSAGDYIFEDLEPGGYVLQFSKASYETATY